MTPKNPQKGFTLIELVIVIGILAILVGVVISVLNPAMYQKKARDVVRKNHINEIAKAAAAYYAENGSWPTTKCQLCPTACLGGTGEGYIKAWPDSDPVKTPNTYTVKSDGSKFCVSVDEEMTTGYKIFWDSDAAKIQENGAGCP